MAATLDLGVLGFSLTLDKSGWNKSWNETDGDINKQSSKLKSFTSNIGTTLKVGVAAAAAAAGTAIVAMCKSGIDNARDLDKQMSLFQAHTGATGEETGRVKDIVKDLYKVNEDSYEDLAKTAEAMRTQMQMSADDIGKYAQNYLDYAKVTGQADDEAVVRVAEIGKAWKLTADENVGLMDKMLVAQQKYGLSVTDSQNALTNLAPSFQALGMDVNDAMSYLSMFSMAGVDTATATTAFTKALNKVKSPQELRKLMTDIQNCNDPLKRAQMASELFGTKAGPQLAQALSDGTISLDDFQAAMNGATGAVSTASAAYDNNFDTRLALLGKKFSGMATEIGEKLLPIAEKMLSWVEAHMPEIEATISTVFDAVGSVVEYFTANILPPLTDAFNAVWSIVQACWPAIEAIISGTIGIIQGLLSGLAALLTGDWSGAWNALKDACGAAWDGIKGIVSGAWDILKSTIGGAMESVGNSLSTGWDSVKSATSSAWDSVKSTVGGAWDSLKSTVGGAVSTVGQNIATGWDGIKTKTGAAWDSVKTATTSAWDNVKSATANTWDAMKSTVGNAVGLLGQSVATGWDGLKTKTGATWEALKSTTSNAWNGMKSTVGTVADAIRSGASTAFDALKSKTSDVWNGIKTAITTPISAARDFVGNIIDTIKRWFGSLSFKLPEFQWPRIKLPHFSLKGEFSLSPLRVPSLSVDWYAKGAIFAKPTIFPTAQGLKGVGDVPGGEVVAPLSTLRDYIKDAMSDVLPTAGALTLVIECDGLAIARTQVNYMDMLLSGQVNKRARGVISGI